MAKRRKFGGFKRKARRLYSSARKRYRHSGSSSGGIIQLPAMAYGALRNPTFSLVQPVTHGVTGMLGDYEDEAVMLGASWALARFGSGFLAEIGRKGLVVENANIGATFTKGISLGGSSTGTGLNLSSYQY